MFAMGNREKQDPAKHLPLTPAVFHVLLAMADGDKHGYAIMKEVARRTEDKVRLSTGTLYGIIARLLSEGMIAETERRPAPELDDERRRYYQLTRFGREVAAAEAERMESAIALAHAKHLFVRTRTV
jgi:DNA-binding PadR family transcriptional regulator